LFPFLLLALRCISSALVLKDMWESQGPYSPSPPAPVTPQVTRSTFIKALEERGSVILCPGGQSELVHTWRAFKSHAREFCLYTRHKGFCRVAIEHGANLVPVLALGEMWQLRNLFEYPALQQYSYRKLGFPVPFVLAGRWGVTPFPMKVPLVYVVGQPIPCPPHEPGREGRGGKGSDRREWAGGGQVGQ
jgi:hypothetical protein